MLINNDYYNRIVGVLESKERAAAVQGVDKPVILFVEGFLDRSVLEANVSDCVLVYSAGNKYYFKAHGIASPRGKVKDAIYEIVNDVLKKEKNFPHLKVFGIVDKDFNNAFVENSNFFITETNDFETLLLSSEAFSYLSIPTCKVEHIASIYGTSYQMGCLRKAFIKYKEGKIYKGKPLNIRNVISEQAIKDNAQMVYQHEKDVSLEYLLNIFSKVNENIFANELDRTLGKTVLEAKLREEKIIDNSGQFINHVKGFKTESVDDYWNKVRGHDICQSAEAIIPDIKAYYDESFEKTVTKCFDRNNFKKTDLYKKMNFAGLMV